ncbi:HNH endonuclease, partial [Mycolicibacterium elephantis]
WRNRSRKLLVLFKGGEPSTSPWCPWINEPLEPEELPPDWEPPPIEQACDSDEPPF